MSWRRSGIDWVNFYHFVSREQKFRSEIGKGESNTLVGNRARKEGRNIFLLWVEGPLLARMNRRRAGHHRNEAKATEPIHPMTPSALRKSKNKTRLLKTDKKRTYLYLKKTRFPPPRSHRMDNRYIDKCPHWLYVGTRCKKFIQMIWRTKQEWKSYKNINADVVDACINLIFITCDLWPFLTSVQLHFWHFDSSYCKTKLLEAWTKWNAKKWIQHPMILEPKDYFQFKNCYWNTVWL